MFKLKIQARALNDVQAGIDYYNSQQKVLGARFFNEIKKSFIIIKRNPFFQIRYDDVRCLPMKKFPYMIHYTVEEKNKLIIIYGIVSSHLNPDENWVKE